MTWKAVIAITIAVGVLVGGILALRGTARSGMPSGELLRRAKERAAKNRAEEAADEEWRR